jgi:methionine-rich copper-binding protein CopC
MPPRLSAVTAFAIFVLFTAVLSAHLSVVKTSPADDSTVSAPPARVQVWFNQAPAARISRLELQGPAGKVPLGEADVDGKERSIAAGVPDGLAPGKYTVAWRAAGDDGHVMRGGFTFTYQPAR